MISVRALRCACGIGADSRGKMSSAQCGVTDRIAGNVEMQTWNEKMVQKSLAAFRIAHEPSVSVIN
jgi:hypothetical protein